tara:strand:- start:1179 stop:1403 length:225 start_codon:yes stop_codon:yes gene_type:complete
MKKETIKYTIRQDGNVTEEVFNVPGDVCLKMTEDIEIKLGDLENRVYTSDYYNQELDLTKDITINTTDNGNVTF